MEILPVCEWYCYIFWKQYCSKFCSVIKNWVNQNLLTVSVFKSKFLSLRTNISCPIKNMKLYSCKNYLNNRSCDQVESIDSYKYLTIMFYKRLNLSESINYLKVRLENQY